MLTPRQQAQFHNFNQLLGLKDFREVSLTDTTQDYRLCEDTAVSALSPVSLKLDSLQELQSILRHTPRATVKNVPKAPPCWDKKLSLKQLSGQHDQLLHQALFLHLTDHAELADSYTEVLEKRFFPLPALAFVAVDVNLKAGQKLNITPKPGHNPVIVNIGTLTMAPGSQIYCTCPVIMTVQQFINT